MTNAFRFELIGSFRVLRDADPLPDRTVGSRKGRTLLKLLLVERGRAVSADRIEEALWGTDPPAKPAENVAALISRLRGVFGPEVVLGGRGGYRVAVGSGISVDVDEAEALAEEAEARLAAGEPALAGAAAARALTILDRGRLLEDEPEAPWADDARTWTERLHRRARQAGWRAALALDDMTGAIAVASAALTADPLDEEACRALMAAHHRAGSSAAALAAYERLRTTLADELGTDPSAETRSLHLSILRGENLTLAPERGPSARHRLDRGATSTGAAVVGDPRFVGREPELDALAGLWAEAAAGTPRLLSICGEAGIGKTRLAAEVIHLAERTGGAVLTAKCYEAERSLFLQPIVEAVRSLVVSIPPDLLRRLAGEWAGTLAELIPEVGRVLRPLGYRTATPEIERRRAFEALTAFLQELARDRPALVVLDDLHNTGASTAEFLHFLIRRVAGDRLLVLATVRTEEGEDVLRHLQNVGGRVDLGPLAEPAVTDLARSMGAADLAPRVMALARGHPLFVVEALRAVAEGSGDLEAAPVPESLRAAVLSRVRRTGPEAEELLRAGAVLGSAFDPRVAAALLDVPAQEASRRSERALAARLLVEAGGDYEFANDLIREVLYRTTPLPSRIAHHRRAADLSQDPETVATHAAAAGDWGRAAGAWTEAAERAASRFAMLDAARLLDRAVEGALSAGDGVTEARALLLRGRAREVLGDYRGAHEDFRAAEALATSTGQLEIEMRSLGELGGDVQIGRGGQTRDCVPYLDAALGLADRIGDARAEVDILSRLCIVQANLLRFDVAYEQGRRALDIARGIGDERALAAALDGLKMPAAYSGDLEFLERVTGELEGILRRRGELWYLQWTVLEGSFAPMARAQWDRAAARFQEVVSLSQRVSDARCETVALSHLCWVERSRGAHDVALAHGERALSRAEALGHPWWISFAETMLSWVLVGRGAPEEALAHLERGLDAVERDGAENFLVRPVAHLAWVAALLGDADRAAEMARRAEGILQAATESGTAFLHGAHAFVATARARLALGHPQRATALLAPTVDAARRVGWREALADGALVMGLARLEAGDPAGAEDPLREALAVARASGLPRIEQEAHRALVRSVPTGR